MTGVYASFGQVTDKSTPTVGGSDCPAGWCAYWQYTFSTFNFHKPRTDCKTGFGLCIRGSASSGCKPCNLFKSMESPAKIENGNVTCYGEVKSGVLEFHIPAAIKIDQNLSAKDISSFTIDKGALSVTANGKQLYSKEGTYPVTLSGSEYVVSIDLE